MSDTTQIPKPSATHPSIKPKVERGSHQPASPAVTLDSTGPAPDELLDVGPSSVLDPSTSGVLSRESSALLQSHAASGGTGSARSAALPKFAGKNFAGVPTHSAKQATVQPKLTVGAAHDPYEEEADRVAEQVMRTLAQDLAASTGAEDSGQQAETSIQRVANEEDDELQTKRISAADSFVADGDFESRTIAASGGGSPLPDETRSFMEPRFGADFSAVRLHTDNEAADLNRTVSAQAFTLGSDIYLGEGKTDVTSDAGKRLLAHELTHVVQQGGVAALHRKSNDEETEDTTKTAVSPEEKAPRSTSQSPETTLNAPASATGETQKATGVTAPPTKDFNATNKAETLVSRGATHTQRAEGQKAIGAAVPTPKGSLTPVHVSAGALSETKEKTKADDVPATLSSDKAPKVQPVKSGDKLEPTSADVQNPAKKADAQTPETGDASTTPAAAIKPKVQSGKLPLATGPQPPKVAALRPEGKTPNTIVLPDTSVKGAAFSDLLQSTTVVPSDEFAQALADAQSRTTTLQTQEQDELTRSMAQVPDPARSLWSTPTKDQSDAASDLETEPESEAKPVAIQHAQVGKSQPTESRQAMTSAGPRPKVPLTQQADTAQIKTHQQATEQTLTDYRAQSDAASQADFGESDLTPTIPFEPLGLEALSTTPAPVADEQPADLPAAPEIPESLRPTVDQIFKPQREARAKELAAQHQQLQAEHEQRTQEIRTASEQKIAAEVAHAEAQQANVRGQTRAEVNQVREQWQADNARVQREHATLVQAQRTQTEQKIENVVQTREQKSDQILTTAEHNAEAERRAAEAQAAEIRRRAEAEAAAQRSQQGVVQRQASGDSGSGGSDPIAAAQAAITALYDRMRAAIERIIAAGKTGSHQEIELARAQAAAEIEQLKAQLHQQIETAFKEYPLLALHAEMKIDQILKQSTESMNRIANDAHSGRNLDEAYRNFQQAANFYQNECKAILSRSAYVAEHGLDAATTEQMVNDLVADIKNAKPEEVKQRTQQVQDMLGRYGVSLTGETKKQTWGYAESLVALTGVAQVNLRLQQAAPGLMDARARQEYQLLEKIGETQGMSFDEFSKSYRDNHTTFDLVYGSIKFERMSGIGQGTDKDGNTYQYWANTSGFNKTSTIQVFSNAFSDTNGYSNGNFTAVQNVIHELGHAFDWRASDMKDPRVPRTHLSDQWTDDAKNNRTTETDPRKFPRRGDADSGFAGPFLGWQQSQGTGEGEEFADTFLGWAYNKWATDAKTGDLTEAGQMRSDWMDEHMPGWINDAGR